MIMGVFVNFVFTAGLLCAVVSEQDVSPTLTRSELLSDVEINNQTNLPVINMGSEGTLLEDLQVSRDFAHGSPNLELVLTAATLVAEVGGKKLMQVNGATYYDVRNKVFSSIGPLLRLNRGKEYSVSLTNDLVQTPPGTGNFTEFQKGLGDTNFHVHGIHEWSGVASQEDAQTYQGGDNIFLVLKGRSQEAENSPGESNVFYGRLPDDHLPGIHWYHPHKHGSTSTQTMGAQGTILVEDDGELWLPDENGCKDFREALSSMKDRIMHMATYSFEQMIPNEGENEWYDANYQEVSLAGGSTICCNNTANSPNALEGTGVTQDLLFVNGGWQPKIMMGSGEYQRFRFIIGGYTGSAMMQIKDPATGEPTDACEMMLYSKDGVYLMEVPRQVSYVFLPSGARAEIVMKCQGPVGKQFDLVTSNSSYPFGDLPPAVQGVSKSFNQKIATIEIDESSTTAASLKEKQCTPLRPAYATDLRNPNLIKNNALSSLALDPVPNFDRDPSGCTMGGEVFSFPDANPFKLEIGKVVGWNRIGGLLAHPLHVHINPFQIQTLPKLFPNTTWDGGYFEAGDYHDTLLIPQMTGKIQLRFQPGPYSGYAVAHCHFLNHEDAGCMRVIDFVCQGDIGEKGICSTKMPVPGTVTVA